MNVEKRHKFSPDRETLARMITRQYEMGQITLAAYEQTMDFLGVPSEERVSQEESEEELEAVPF